MRPILLAAATPLCLLAACSHEPLCRMQPPSGGAVAAAGTATSSVSSIRGALRPDQLSDKIGERMRARESAVRAMEAGDGSRNILLLSGGGQLGAYGVGVLNGWTESGKRPTFDVVAGVSTGALSATFAFLGPEYDTRLRDLYLNLTQHQVLRNRSWLSLPFADSLASNEPLKKLIAKEITIKELRKVREAGENGRSLFVGAVELKSGQFVAFDLTDIAQMNDEQAALDLFHKCLAASAAIPVVFPPECFAPFAFADGGTRQNVFLPAVVSATTRASGAHPTNVYIVLNNWSETAPELGLQANLLQLAGRATDLLFREAQLGALRRIHDQAAELGYEASITQLTPSDCQAAHAACAPSVTVQVCHDYMQCLYDLGHQRAIDKEAFTPLEAPAAD
ncbi:MAG: patatin-like phospholipase family protein [Phycisphaerales bacterium]